MYNHKTRLARLARLTHLTHLTRRLPIHPPTTKALSEPPQLLAFVDAVAKSTAAARLPADLAALPAGFAVVPTAAAYVATEDREASKRAPFVLLLFSSSFSFFLFFFLLPLGRSG